MHPFHPETVSGRSSLGKRTSRLPPVVFSTQDGVESGPFLNVKNWQAKSLQWKKRQSRIFPSHDVPLSYVLFQLTNRKHRASHSWTDVALENSCNRHSVRSEQISTSNSHAESETHKNHPIKCILKYARTFI